MHKIYLQICPMIRFSPGLLHPVLTGFSSSSSHRVLFIKFSLGLLHPVLTGSSSSRLRIPSGGTEIPTRTYLEFGDHNRRAHIPNIHSSPAAQCIRGLSLAVWTTMATDGTYKTKLAEKCHYLSERKDKSMGADTTTRKY